MKSRPDPAKTEALRRRAEERLRTPSPAAATSTSDHESVRLRQQLDVAEVELEMQDEELRENQNLLTEVQHRAKNNLQMLTSLLHLEEKSSQHPGTKSVLQGMQGRMRSVALLHEIMYCTEASGAVDLARYIDQIITHLFSSLCDPHGAIRSRTNLASVRVSVDRAIPCGLIVNELVTNCLKHGFPVGGPGEVAIELQPIDGDRLRLRVSDNGVGLPADFGARRMASLGMQLVSDLTEQLDGQLEIGPGPDAVFSVTFPPIQPGAKQSE